ncbi:MAG: hypothetical protein FJ280_27700 [Planctomycetes bacterium]|nr:hypothetical protein [Planctomycetota bacterium]
MRTTRLMLVGPLVATLLMAPGCSQIMDTVFLDPLGVHDFEVPLCQAPVLPDTTASLLNRAAPLRFCVLPFEDARGVDMNRVGEFRMLNADGTLSVGRYVINSWVKAGKQASVADLLTQAVAHELARNGHAVAGLDSTQVGCEVTLQGKVRAFWAARTELVKGPTIPGYDYQAAVQMDIWAGSTSDSAAAGGRSFSGYAAANYISGFPRFADIGRLLDTAVLQMLRSFSNDQALLDMIEASQQKTEE